MLHCEDPAVRVAGQHLQEALFKNLKQNFSSWCNARYHLKRLQSKFQTCPWNTHGSVRNSCSHAYSTVYIKKIPKKTGQLKVPITEAKELDLFSLRRFLTIFPQKRLCDMYSSTPRLDSLKGNKQLRSYYFDSFPVQATATLERTSSTCCSMLMENAPTIN